MERSDYDNIGKECQYRVIEKDETIATWYKGIIICEDYVSFLVKYYTPFAPGYGLRVVKKENIVILNHNIMEQQIKNMRVRIDALSNLVKELGNVELMGPKGPVTESFLNHQLQRSYDELILAKAWLGKVLECLGTESPYKNDGKRKTVADIEPTADQGVYIDPYAPDYLNNSGIIWSEATTIEKIDFIRQRIKEKIDNPGLMELDSDHKYFNEILSCLNHHSRHLNEARFWLGFELQRIRESHN